MSKYVHGYSEREKTRLEDQANTLDNLLHHDTVWDKGETILEAGCGVGAQTQIIAPKNPASHFTSVDISVDSIIKAKQTMEAADIKNVQFQVADIFDLPFESESFNAVRIFLNDPFAWRSIIASPRVIGRPASSIFERFFAKIILSCIFTPPIKLKISDKSKPFFSFTSSADITVLPSCLIV